MSRDYKCFPSSVNASYNRRGVVTLLYLKVKGKEGDTRKKKIEEDVGLPASHLPHETQQNDPTPCQYSIKVLPLSGSTQIFSSHCQLKQ